MIKLLDLAGSTHHNILLLQGPVGPFFRYLASDIQQAGSKVFKVNFNGGDWLFYPTNAINYNSSISKWPDFLERFIEEKNIDLVLLFGDCRPIHKRAHAVATKLGVEVGVFEEGYVRPNYVTLERFGVNANSSLLQRSRELITEQSDEPTSPQTVPYPFWHAMVWAMLYNLAATALSVFFGENKHHRDLYIFDGIKWLRSFFRKKLYHIKEQKIYSRITKELSGRFFLVPLQVNNDAQIHEHSRFNSNQEFIKEVILSFSAHAPQDTFLVIKQHPLDRGYNNYGPLIRDLADSLGILERTFYIHDFCLPTLLGCSIGVVVINSTVGLSALHHKKPLIALGDAIYSRPELTFQGSLNDFWKNAKFNSGEYYNTFISHVIQTTQINGNFYRRLPLSGYRSGLIWS